MSRADREVANSVAEALRSQARQAGWANNPVAWANDVLGVHLWSKQKEISESVSANKRTVVASCHGTGKALCVDTLIPTPGGLVRMGDITVGSKVYGSDGSMVDVVATTGVHRADRYRLTLLADGEETEVIASGDHLWPVMTARSMAKATMGTSRVAMPAPHFGTWHHLAQNLDTRTLNHMFHSNHRLMIPGRRPVLRDDPRPWRAEKWVEDIIRARGVCDEAGRPAIRWVAHGKEQPEELTRARRSLTEDGIKTLLHRRRHNASMTWTLSILSMDAIRLLPDASERALARNAAVDRQWDVFDPGPDGWLITGVARIADGDVQCIQVDAPDHLYLCTEQGIPTHNSMIASVLACWWVNTRPPGDAIVVSTAPTYAQVNKILWEEIRKHHATAQQRGFPMIGRVTQSDEWKTDAGQVVAFGRKPATGDRHAFHGIHRRYVLVVIDEACGVPEEIWTGVEAITTTEGCRILAIGNPDDRNTEFGKVYLKPEMADMWHRISVPASSTPNFTGEPVPDLLKDVLVSKKWCEERLQAWGKNDPRYIAKVDARFPDVSKSSLFAPSLVAQAFDEVPPQMRGNILRLGVDVARFGSDQNVVVSYAGRTARVESTWTGTDTTSSAHQVLKLAEDIKDRTKSSWVEIRVDAVGLGAGVVDTLNARLALLPEPWYSVYEMHGSAAAPTDLGGSVHGYGNARAYWFDQLRQMMRNGSVKVDDHEKLKDDLAIIFYSIRNGKLYIAPKEEMKAKHGRSPDFADALVYATAPVLSGPQVGDTHSESATDMAQALDDYLDSEDFSISPF
jgi:hypothetical protein